jgi:hypothetical protein
MYDHCELGCLHRIRQLSGLFMGFIDVFVVFTHSLENCLSCMCTTELLPVRSSSGSDQICKIGLYSSKSFEIVF